ncbi:fimbrial biogenesis chaperone [Serratia sp. D1N4]
MVSLLMCAARKAPLGILLCALPWGAAQALININPKIVEMKDDQTTVWVTNTGDKPEFVNITLFEVTNPGAPPEEEQRIPLGLVKAPSLYAAPFKLTLGPRQEKQVQLKALTRPDKEKVYRLAVMPQQQATISGTHNNVMLVGLGYMGLVRQLPLTQTATWRHDCQADGLHLEATGTVRVEFRELMQDGKVVDDFNVYPGTPRLLAGKNLRGKAQDTSFTLQCDR